MQDAADDVLDAAEHYLHSLWSNYASKDVRAAFLAKFHECLDAYAGTRRSNG